MSPRKTLRQSEGEARGCHMMMHPPRPSYRLMAPYPGFIIPFSFYSKLIFELILLDFGVDLSCFCLEGSNFHYIILSLFIEGAPRARLCGITPTSKEEHPRIGHIFACAPAKHPKQLSIMSTKSHMKDMCFGKNRSSAQHRECVQHTFSNLTLPHDSAIYYFLMEVVWSNVHLLQRVIASLYYHYAVVKQEPE